MDDVVCTNRGMSRVLSSSSLTTAPDADMLRCFSSLAHIVDRRLMSTGRSSGSMSDSSTVDGLSGWCAAVAGRPTSASQLQLATSTPLAAADWTPGTSNNRLRRRRVKATTRRTTTATVMTTAQPTNTVDTIFSCDHVLAMTR